MTSWLSRGQTVISNFSPPSGPLKVYTRPEVQSGYKSPESQYKAPAGPQSGYSASPTNTGYSAPPAPAPPVPPQSGYSSAPAAHTTHTHGGYASEQSGYSSHPALSTGYAGLSTPIPIIPVPTYLPIHYDMVQIPPGYQVAKNLTCCILNPYFCLCLSDSSPIYCRDCWYGSYSGNLVVAPVIQVTSQVICIKASKA